MKLKVDQLVVTKENPRRTPASEASHKALVASIVAHGLIQPIVVRPLADNDNKFEVIAGSRRLRAVQEAGLDEIEVVVNEAEFGVSELGAAENMLREAMHPLDEAAVISRLVADGETTETVASRFGQTPRWAEQRIKLNGLAPKVQAAFRDGRITIAAAEAFTLADKKTQEAYLAKAKDFQLEADVIRRTFTNLAIPAHHALFDLDLYPQASIRRDLFSEDVWCEDREAFDKLQKEAITALKEDLLKKEGWGDVLLFWNGPDYSISNKYVRAEGRILKEDRAKHVVLVTYHPGSGLCAVDRGLVLRKATSKVQVGKTPDADTTKPEDVATYTADDLNDNQMQILAGMQLEGIAASIEGGNIHMALLTLLGPLLNAKEPGMPYMAGQTAQWSTVRQTFPDLKPTNDMMNQAIELPSTREKALKLPSLEKLAESTVSDIGHLLCGAALRVLQTMRKPDKTAAKLLKADGIAWFRLDSGLLRRYRLDALQDLAKRVGVETEGLKKSEIIEKMEAIELEAGDFEKLLKVELK